MVGYLYNVQCLTRFPKMTYTSSYTYTLVINIFEYDISSKSLIVELWIDNIGKCYHIKVHQSSRLIEIVRVEYSEVSYEMLVWYLSDIEILSLRCDLDSNDKRPAWYCEVNNRRVIEEEWLSPEFQPKWLVFIPLCPKSYSRRGSIHWFLETELIADLFIHLSVHPFPLPLPPFTLFCCPIHANPTPPPHQ